MAKGNRRLTTSRSERLLGTYGGGGGYSNGHHHPDSEFREEDIWSTIHDVDVDDDDGGGSYHRDVNGWSESNGGGGMSLSTRRRTTPRNAGGGLSLAFEDSSNSMSTEKIQATTPASRIVHQFGSGAGAGAGATPSPRHVASSAPVNVPDWSKILRIDSVESLHEMSYGGGDHDNSSDEMVPPHEYLAREYARGRKSGGASVFEGVGRTLKGRDLRRVRDAVWNQTGFDG